MFSSLPFLREVGIRDALINWVHFPYRCETFSADPEAAVASYAGVRTGSFKMET
jgi:hypothetical protein